MSVCPFVCNVCDMLSRAPNSLSLRLSYLSGLSRVCLKPLETLLGYFVGQTAEPKTLRLVGQKKVHSSQPWSTFLEVQNSEGCFRGKMMKTLRVTLRCFFMLCM